MKRVHLFLACAMAVGAVLLPTMAPAQPQAPGAAPANTLASTRAIGQESSWPLTVKAGSATLTVYQPQLEKWDGNRLTTRMAVQAAVGKNAQRSTYGMVRLNLRALADKGTRVVTIDRAEVAGADFPAASSSEVKGWSEAIARDLAGKSRAVALDRFEVQLAVAGAVRQVAALPLRNDPPKILFSQTPAMLVTIDRAPVYRALSGTRFERVINTRPLVLRDSLGTHYLKIFDGWMSAASLAGPWQVLNPPAAGLDDAYKRAAATGLIDPLSGKSGSGQGAPSLAKLAPVIYVALEPTELIVTDGAPKYVPVSDTRLLYVENSTGHVFRNTADQLMYVLVSGRWFRAKGEGGPWEFIRANELPGDFSNIPDDSPVENVKASVAGTAQAREAVVAAGIPQTAAVKRSGTRLAPPKTDGPPQFRKVEGTNLEYVANTPLPVIRVEDGTLYALQNGVWFVSATMQGPWGVAISVPPSIYTIGPASPLYYVTFVRIYGVEGDIVYVGYTPGYQGTYVDPATGVVVYGTGYSYDPWMGTAWYGDPVTYGYAAAVTYTPWDGWVYGFGFGWYWGVATMAYYDWGWGPYPYWGPWVYPAYGVAYGAGGGALAWGPGGWAGYTGNVYSQWGNRATVSRGAGGYNAWTGNAWAAQAGRSYNSRTGISSAGQRGAVENVYTGNYAAGARGAAVGPGGNAVVMERGTAGNANSGAAVSGNRGAFYNSATGQWTSFGGATGAGGGQVAHVGDNIYAGKDGNVYRNTGSGWEQHTASGWQSVPGSAQGEAMRQAGGGLGAQKGAPPEGGGLSRAGGSGSAAREPAHEPGHIQELNRDMAARQQGEARAQQLRQSSAQMHRDFGGMHAGMGGGMRGGFHGGRR